MKRSYKKKLKVIAAYLLILLILIMLYYADFINNLNQQNKKTAQQIVSATERMLDQGELAGQNILEKFPKSSSCEEILPYLRELATTLPYVRSWG